MFILTITVLVLVPGALAGDGFTGLVVSNNDRVTYNSDEDTLLFKNVELDQGGLYDSTTGVVTIPTGKGGIYLVTVRPDPSGGATLQAKVRVNGNTEFSHSGQQIPSGTSVALDLADGDTLQVTVPDTATVEGGTLFSIVRTSATSAFAATPSQDRNYNMGDVVEFDDVITSVGVTVDSANKKITVINPGLYVATVRSDPRDARQGWWSWTVITTRLDLILRVNGDNVMTSYGERSVKSSSSVVIALEPNDVIDVITDQNELVQQASLVSLVQIQSDPNNAVAYTGYVNINNINQKNPVLFNNAQTDVGNIYSSTTGEVTIPADAFYVICPRPDPEGSYYDMTFNVFVNGNDADIVIYGEKSVPNGICATLDLDQNDKVKVIASTNGDVETASFLSVARVD